MLKTAAVSIKNPLFGGSVLKASRSDATFLINTCFRNRFSYEKISYTEEDVCLTLSALTAKRLAFILKKHGIECEVQLYGIPKTAKKFGKRYGLILGIITIFALNVLSGRYIWDIRVEGNKSMTEAEVKSELSAVGFEIGSPTKGRDVDEISNAVLISSEKIAWLSINMHGTVAYVNIREKLLPDQKDDMENPSNIIAKSDGIIEHIEVLRGNAAVKEGDSVKEGDLLISGISESTRGEYRTEHALGNVYAETNHSFEIKIPLIYDKKVSRNSICSGITVKFFSKNVNIFKKGGNLGASCVTIMEEDQFTPDTLPPLPVSVVRYMTREYDTVREKRSVTEASELAFFELQNLIAASLDGGELLRKNIRTEITDTEFILRCDIISSENIATTKTIENN